MAPAMQDAPPESSCVYVDADLAGRAWLAGPDAPIPRQLGLSRSRVEAGLTHGVASGRVALTAVRTTPDGGLQGIDGESFVPRVQIAEARVVWPQTGLALMGGVIDEPWVFSANQAVTARALGPTLAEAVGLLPRADVGLGGIWTAPDGLADVTLTATTGEGFRFRERNAGQTLTVMARLHPSEWLHVVAYGREGSVGIGSVRDHRIGARAHVTFPGLRAGVELLQAWGVAGDSERTPLAPSGWLRVERDGLGAWVRYAGSFDANDAHIHDILAAGGLLPDSAARPWSLVAVSTVRQTGPGASPVPGTSASEWTIGLQLGTRIQVYQPLTEELP